MKISFIRGLLLGVFATSSLITIASGSYLLYLYQTAKPGFVISKEPQSFTDSEINRITRALVKLSQVSSLFGLSEKAATTVGSAAAIIGQKSPLLADITLQEHLKLLRR